MRVLGDKVIQIEGVNRCNHLTKLSPIRVSMHECVEVATGKVICEIMIPSSRLFKQRCHNVLAVFFRVDTWVVFSGSTRHVPGVVKSISKSGMSSLPKNSTPMYAMLVYQQHRRSCDRSDPVGGTVADCTSWKSSLRLAGSELKWRALPARLNSKVE